MYTSFRRFSDYCTIDSKGKGYRNITVYIYTLLHSEYAYVYRLQCLFLGTFVEAIDTQKTLCYTIIVIEFCASCPIVTAASFAVLCRYAALHTLLSLYAGSGISMPTTLLFHVI